MTEVSGERGKKGRVRRVFIRSVLSCVCVCVVHMSVNANAKNRYARAC